MAHFDDKQPTAQPTHAIHASPYQVRRIRQFVQGGLRETIPLLIDRASRQPLVAPNIWLLTRRLTVGPRTLANDAYDLQHLLRLVSPKDGTGIETRLAAQSGITKSFLSFTLIPWLWRPSNSQVKKMVTLRVSTGVFNARTLTALSYLTHRYEELITSEGTSQARALSIRAQLDVVRDVLLKALRPRDLPEERIPLDSAQKSTLYEAIGEASPNNPWKTGKENNNFIRLRNATIAIVFDRYGMRRGELAKLKMKDIALIGPNPTIAVVVRYDDPQETRANEPGQKGKSRLYELDKFSAAVLRRYSDARAELLGGRDCPFVFISSVDGKALSLSQINRIIQSLSKSVSAAVFPHLFRHGVTERLVVELERHGYAEHEIIKAVKEFNGWSTDNLSTYTQGLQREQRLAVAKIHQEGLDS